MGTKRVGWARIKSLVNENQNELSRRNRRIIAASADKTLSASESGATILWTKGTSHTITLPAAEAGLNFKVVIKKSSDNLHKIAAASGDCFFGQVIVQSSNATHDSAMQQVVYATAVADPGDYDHLHIDGNASTTGSGVGSVIELECVDGTAWRVTALLVTSAASPASISTIQAS